MLAFFQNVSRVLIIQNNIKDKSFLMFRIINRIYVDATFATLLFLFRLLKRHKHVVTCAFDLGFHLRERYEDVS